MRRVTFLEVPVDEVDFESAIGKFRELLLDEKKHHIVFLTTRGILKARIDPEYLRCLQNASMILPVSRAIVRGARFTGTANFNRFLPFEVVIHLLGLVESLEKAAYLFGAKKEDLEQAEKNLRASFPDLKLVGRFSGYFPSKMEKNIILTIKKSSPTLLLVGKGVPDNEKWIFRNMAEFTPGLYLWADNCFEVFAGKEKKKYRILDNIVKPWRLLRVFGIFSFYYLLLVTRIKKKTTP